MTMTFLSKMRHVLPQIFKAIYHAAWRHMNKVQRLSRCQKLSLFLALAMIGTHGMPYQQRHRTVARRHRATTSRAIRRRKVIRRGSINRTSTTKRGDRHFDVAGGISGSVLHPKNTRFRATYMSKREMTCWQLMHRNNNAHDEKNADL